MERAAITHTALIVKLLANVAAVLWSSMRTSNIITANGYVTRTPSDGTDNAYTHTTLSFYIITHRMMTAAEDNP